MKTTDLIKSHFCNFNSDNNILIINEDKRNKLQRPIFISGLNFNVASFNNAGQLERFISEFEIDIDHESKQTHHNDVDGKVIMFKCLNNFYNPLFWNLSELPEGCKKVKALSNGSVVDCYFLKNGLDIIIYRPNPNAANVYNPMELDERIKHYSERGVY